MRYTTIDTKFDPSKQPIPINSFSGSYDDPNARIWPFKRMHTIQPYDKGNNTLVYMHLWGEDKDALWGNYDFGRAIRSGMKQNGKPYSGQYGFVETYSYWPTTHMVAPKEKALACGECHARNGRLADPRGLLHARARQFPMARFAGYLADGGHVRRRARSCDPARPGSRRYRKGQNHD